MRGEVTYTVVKTAMSARTHDEQRTGERRRTRLRTGKLADARSRFVIECIFHDRSADGAKLRLVKDVPLPAPLLVYDDETGAVASARVVWRDGQDVGIRFEARADPAGNAQSLGNQFYAMPRSGRCR